MLRLEGVKGNGNLRGTAATSLGYIEIQDEKEDVWPVSARPRHVKVQNVFDSVLSSIVDVELRASRLITEGISRIVLASYADNRDIMRVEKP